MPETEIPEYVNEQPRPGQKHETDTSPGGRNVYRLVAVSFGLLCIVQVALNILLHLYVHKNTDNLEDRLKKVTEERDELKRKLIDIVTHKYTQSGWQYFKGSVYYVSPSIVKTWNQSREDCLQRGADLMIIDTTEEQNFTRQLKDNMWIGLIKRKGMWNWVDGTPLTTSYWMDEPISYEDRGANCGEVELRKKENNWNDKPCNIRQFWICEKKVPL